MSRLFVIAFVTCLAASVADGQYAPNPSMYRQHPAYSMQGWGGAPAGWYQQLLQTQPNRAPRPVFAASNVEMQKRYWMAGGNGFQWGGQQAWNQNGWAYNQTPQSNGLFGFGLLNGNLGQNLFSGIGNGPLARLFASITAPWTNRNSTFMPRSTFMPQMFSAPRLAGSPVWPRRSFARPNTAPSMMAARYALPPARSYGYEFSPRPFGAFAGQVPAWQRYTQPSMRPQYAIQPKYVAPWQPAPSPWQPHIALRPVPVQHARPMQRQAMPRSVAPRVAPGYHAARRVPVTPPNRAVQAAPPKLKPTRPRPQVDPTPLVTKPSPPAKTKPATTAKIRSAIPWFTKKPTEATATTAKPKPVQAADPVQAKVSKPEPHPFTKVPAKVVTTDPQPKKWELITPEPVDAPSNPVAPLNPVAPAAPLTPAAKPAKIEAPIVEPELQIIDKNISVNEKELAPSTDVKNEIAAFERDLGIDGSVAAIEPVEAIADETMAVANSTPVTAQPNAIQTALSSWFGKYSNAFAERLAPFRANIAKYVPYADTVFAGVDAWPKWWPAVALMPLLLLNWLGRCIVRTRRQKKFEREAGIGMEPDEFRIESGSSLPTSNSSVDRSRVTTADASTESLESEIAESPVSKVVAEPVPVVAEPVVAEPVLAEPALAEPVAEQPVDFGSESASNFGDFGPAEKNALKTFGFDASFVKGDDQVAAESTKSTENDDANTEDPFLAYLEELEGNDAPSPEEPKSVAENVEPTNEADSTDVKSSSFSEMQSVPTDVLFDDYVAGLKKGSEPSSDTSQNAEQRLEFAEQAIAEVSEDPQPEQAKAEPTPEPFPDFEDFETEWKSEPEPKSEAKPEPTPEPFPEFDSDLKPEATSELKSESKPATTSAKTEAGPVLESAATVPAPRPKKSKPRKPSSPTGGPASAEPSMKTIRKVKTKPIKKTTAKSQTPTVATGGDTATKTQVKPQQKTKTETPTKTKTPTKSKTKPDPTKTKTAPVIPPTAPTIVGDPRAALEDSDTKTIMKTKKKSGARPGASAATKSTATKPRSKGQQPAANADKLKPVPATPKTKSTRKPKRGPNGATVPGKPSKPISLDSQSDDLTRIYGLTVSAVRTLEKSGITSFADLAGRSPQEVQDVLAKAGSRFCKVDASTWPEQAALAADGNWSELKLYKKKDKN